MSVRLGRSSLRAALRSTLSPALRDDMVARRKGVGRLRRRRRRRKDLRCASLEARSNIGLHSGVYACTGEIMMFFSDLDPG